ncbi:hypothetical protein [Sphingobium sp. TomMM35A]
MGQHIVWFRRYLAISPIGESAIGDFFLTSNGLLFRALYTGIALVGIDPVAAAWAIGLGSAVLAALCAWRFARAAGAETLTSAFVPAALILFLSFRDDAATGSARAIGWAVLAAALWMLAGRHRWWMMIVLCVGALIYPPIVALALCIVMIDQLISFYRTRDWADLLLWGIAAVVPALLVLATLLPADPWGPTVTLAEAKQLSDFQPGGRAQFFFEGSARFWLTGSRSGLIPSNVYHAWPLVAAGIAGLFLAKSRGKLLYWNSVIAGSGLLLWIAAHFTLFTLYLPSRFPSYAIGIVVALSASSLADQLCAQRRYWLVGLFTLAPLCLYGFKGSWPYAGLRGLDSPELAPALLDNSQHGVVAGLSPDLDRLPIAVSRTVYWSWETALPYKSGYRSMMRRRLNLTIDALLATQPSNVLRWAAANDIAFIILPKGLFDRNSSQRWETMIDTHKRAELERPGLPQRSWLWGQRLEHCAIEGTADWLISVACLRSQTSVRWNHAL